MNTPVSWIALIVSACSLGYAVWNEVSKRRLQFEARFVYSVGASEYNAAYDEPKDLTLENVGSGSAHDVLLIFEFDPAGVGFGEFSWAKVPPGESVTKRPTAKMPEDLGMIVVSHKLRDRSHWWNRKVLLATAWWTTPFGRSRQQRFYRSKRSMRL
jgi:hypothetical protein